ncbi:MAG: hypothetical protein JXB25_06295 [Deltaproteobacteria bacterium]|nr:hypothetical protein [Deltaproteobacteria bacterium]
MGKTQKINDVEFKLKIKYKKFNLFLFCFWQLTNKMQQILLQYLEDANIGPLWNNLFPIATVPFPRSGQRREPFVSHTLVPESHGGGGDFYPKRRFRVTALKIFRGLFRRLFQSCPAAVIAATAACGK